MWILFLSQEDGDNDDNRIERQQQNLTLVATGVIFTLGLLLMPWIIFLRGNSRILTRFFYRNTSFLVSPIIGTGTIYSLGPSKPFAQALCYHGIAVTNLSYIVTLFLKVGTKRQRPCCTFPQYIERKNLTIIPKILAKIAGTRSFPSGDAMSAAAWAIPVWYVGYPFVAVVMTSSTAFGRMFFLAHHFGDTLGGIGIPLLFHGLTAVYGNSYFIPELGSAKWYHPLAALGTVIIITRLREREEKRSPSL